MRQLTGNVAPRADFPSPGDGDKTAILISNVRDDNYYDTNNAHAFSYIAGFFSGQVNDFFDRNVMTSTRTTGSTGRRRTRPATRA